MEEIRWLLSWQSVSNYNVDLTYIYWSTQLIGLYGLIKTTDVWTMKSSDPLRAYQQIYYRPKYCDLQNVNINKLLFWNLLLIRIIIVSGN